ncbi:MAG: hypothetical protein ACXU98_07385 [Syntrophales bacterium]
MKPSYQIVSKESSRQMLAKDFESLGGELPIRGGWGYTKDDACIIDKHDSVVDPSIPFDGAGIEHIFVEKRIYEEMIILRPEGEKFFGIQWKLIEQQVIDDEDRVFDKLIFKISAFPEKDWNELKAEYEGPEGYGSPNFYVAVYEKERQERMVQFTREFWFDITSFYERGLVIADKSTGLEELLPPKSVKFTDKLKKLLGIK